MKKTTAVLTAMIIIILSICTVVSAAPSVGNGFIKHTVVRGDTMWRLSVAHGVPLSDVIASNPHIRDPHWIYPGDIIYIPTKSGTAKVGGYEEEVARRVNEIRREHGLSELYFNEALSNVARAKSEDMRAKNYFAHQSPTYGSPFDMMRSFGIKFSAAGENIAKGYATPAAVVDGWMNSAGHRANILSSTFTQIGVGYVADGNYWTQMFIV